MTVKELKEFLSKFDDDTKVITVSGNYEMRGSMVKASVSEGTYIECERDFRDDFDGTWYSSTVYRRNKEGEKFVCIWG